MRNGETKTRPVLFSGSAPSGNLTLGDYIGAISQWKSFQADCDSVFCIVDLHAITTPKDPDMLRTKTLDFLALYVACGLDPEESTIFIQSQNPHHTELAWILNCCTRYGDLTRMTQFKEKSARTAGITAGLLNYPVLMAADILLYQAELVPIGADQKQHLELCSEIARRFNARFEPVFRIPKAFVPERGARIRNLLDPSSKMDKSHRDARTYISLLDSDDEIRSKIMKAKTDSDGEFRTDDPNQGIANLVTIMSCLQNTPAEELVARYRSLGYAKLKADLADVVIDFLAEVRQEYGEIRHDEAALQRLQRLGREKAIERSRITMTSAKEACGLIV